MAVGDVGIGGIGDLVDGDGRSQRGVAGRGEIERHVEDVGAGGGAHADRVGRDLPRIAVAGLDRRRVAGGRCQGAADPGRDCVLDVVVGDCAADSHRAGRDTDPARDRDDLGGVDSVYGEVIKRTDLRADIVNADVHAVANEVQRDGARHRDTRPRLTPPEAVTLMSWVSRSTGSGRVRFWSPVKALICETDND